MCTLNHNGRCVDCCKQINGSDWFNQYSECGPNSLSWHWKFILNGFRKKEEEEEKRKLIGSLEQIKWIDNEHKIWAFYLEYRKES